MKIFISHKFRGVNKKVLRKEIEKISNLLEKEGHKTFNYFRDKENWIPQEFPQGKVIKDAFKEIKKCDIFLAFVNYKEPSEGLLLEFGFAKALNKEIILLINESRCSTFLESISDKVIKFKDLKEINSIK